MMATRFIRVRGRIVPIKDKGVAVKKKEKVSLGLEVSSYKRPAATRFKESGKAGAIAGGVIGGISGLQLGLRGLVAGAVVGGTSIGLISGAIGAAFGSRTGTKIKFKKVK